MLARGTSLHIHAHTHTHIWYAMFCSYLDEWSVFILKGDLIKVKLACLALDLLRLQAKCFAAVEITCSSATSGISARPGMTWRTHDTVVQHTNAERSAGAAHL